MIMDCSKIRSSIEEDLLLPRLPLELKIETDCDHFSVCMKRFLVFSYMSWILCQQILLGSQGNPQERKSREKST
jgi:hypothetical protein